ncbi:MAG: Gfo/Idh/MocA family oxidoreductase [Oscillospiraceae bacterium]|jgi:predicted dehydrogenase|nr:Gfo/Idh/MocA family oxidoreductase [Oscillospiraceae bacterium]
MLNVAIIGTGNISRMHIESFQKFPERCKITRLVDIYPEKAQERKDIFGLKDATVLHSHKDILDDPDVDLVSICTPPYCHAEIAIDCLSRGKNVIVEKPMAASLEECDAMIAAAKKSGKVFSVIAQNRFRGPIAKLKATLDSGLIGRVLHAQVDSFWWRGHSYYDLWWRGLWEKEGGGCTLNHAVHHIDMLGWMMGMPKTVTAVLSNANHDNSEVEDISVAVLQYGGGALAQVTSSVIHHGEEQQLIFQGEHARVSAPWKVAAQISAENGFPKEGDNPALIKTLNDFYDNAPEPMYIAHTGQIDDMLRAVETGSEPMITGEQGRMTIELITGIYKAGSEKRTVNLPIEKNDSFYTLEGIMKSVPHFFEKTASLTHLGGSITVGNDYEGKYKIKEKQ